MWQARGACGTGAAAGDVVSVNLVGFHAKAGLQLGHRLAGKRAGACGFEFLGVERFPRGAEIRARVISGSKTFDLSGAKNWAGQ